MGTFKLGPFIKFRLAWYSDDSRYVVGDLA